MTGRNTWWLLAGLVVVVGLPLLAHWLRRPTEAGCALDGLRIDPRYRVAIVDHLGTRHAFCCLRCAEIWLQKESKFPPRSVTVTDEATGERVDAALAWYVRSAVATNRITGNRIHVFQSQADALKHAADFAGVVLEESEKPFR
jgi:hypothetical protein